MCIGVFIVFFLDLRLKASQNENIEKRYVYLRALNTKHMTRTFMCPERLAYLLVLLVVLQQHHPFSIQIDPILFLYNISNTINLL